VLDCFVMEQIVPLTAGVRPVRAGIGTAETDTV